MLIAFFAIIYKPLNLQRPFQKSEVRDSECLVYETKLRQPDGCRFRFSAGDRAAAQPDFPIPPAPPRGTGERIPPHG